MTTIYTNIIKLWAIEDFLNGVIRDMCIHADLTGPQRKQRIILAARLEGIGKEITAVRKELQEKESLSYAKLHFHD